MSLFGNGLDAAVHKAFTRPVPKSAPAQMRYLVRQMKGTKAVAQMLRISQRTVERYVKNQIRKPRPDLAARLEREVKKRWQPQIRARARRRAATSDGIVIDTRARIGYTAPIGTTDEDRIRHLTVALPPRYAARLFDAQEQGASEQQLRKITAEGLKEVYFQDDGRRAASSRRSASPTSSTWNSTCRRPERQRGARFRCLRPDGRPCSSGSDCFGRRCQGAGRDGDRLREGEHPRPFRRFRFASLVSGVRVWVCGRISSGFLRVRRWGRGGGRVRVFW